MSADGRHMCAALEVKGRFLNLLDVCKMLRNTEDPKGVLQALAALQALLPARPDELQQHAGEHACFHPASNWAKLIHILGVQCSDGCNQAAAAHAFRTASTCDCKQIYHRRA